MEELCRVVNKYKEPYDVYIGRGSKWGNPFPMENKSDEERDRVCDLYEEYFWNSNLKNDLSELKGKVLGCYCKPKRCHGDFLAEQVNRKFSKDGGDNMNKISKYTLEKMPINVEVYVKMLEDIADNFHKGDLVSIKRVEKGIYVDNVAVLSADLLDDKITEKGNLCFYTELNLAEFIQTDKKEICVSQEEYDEVMKLIHEADIETYESLDDNDVVIEKVSKEPDSFMENGKPNFNYFKTEKFKKEKLEADRLREEKEKISSITCCFTAHRPSKLYGYDLADENYKKLAKVIYAQVKELILKKSVRRFITGGALGGDTLCFMVIHNIKKMVKFKDLGIKNILAVPFENQFIKWGEFDIERYNNMKKFADEVVYVDILDDYKVKDTEEGVYDKQKMQERNKYMVDNSSHLIAIWDGSYGGTYNCIKYAKYKIEPIIKINPKYFDVSYYV